YTPADFAQFAPRTALDMLNRVPGFSIKQEDQARGLGEATGNIVINGQRMSGKSNDVVTELGRIPVANVVRIEIVDGATLNIPGLSGQVANVIVKSTGITGQWEYRPEFRSYYTDPPFTRFNVTEDQHGDNYEIGGDYEFDLGRGRLKFIGLGRGNKYPDAVTVVTDFADAAPSIGNRFDQVGTERELIGRSEYRWKANGGEWQI